MTDIPTLLPLAGLPLGGLPLGGRPESLVVLLLALALSTQLRDRGPFARLLGAPADRLRRLARTADHRLNRLQRGAAVRRARGALLVLAVAAAALLLGWCLAAAAAALSHGWTIADRKSVV